MINCSQNFKKTLSPPLQGYTMNFNRFLLVSFQILPIQQTITIINSWSCQRTVFYIELVSELSRQKISIIFCILIHHWQIFCFEQSNGKVHYREVQFTSTKDCKRIHLQLYSSTRLYKQWSVLWPWPSFDWHSNVE